MSIVGSKRPLILLAILVALLSVIAVHRWRRHAAAGHPETPDLPEPTPPLLVERRTLPSTRTYLSVSPGPAKLPIVLVIHGDDGDAESMRRFTGFDRATNRAAHVAFVESGKKYWDRSDLEAPYLESVIRDLAETRGADASRVFVFGWSSGAYLAQTFSCDHDAVVATTLCEARGQFCKKPKPTLVLHNTGDTEHSVAGADELVSTLCPKGTSAPWIPGCVSYAGCDSPLSYCRVPGGSHYPWRSAARVAWQFFSER